MVVGYCNNDANEGISVQTFSFLNVGTELIDVTDVVPVSVLTPGDALDGNVSLIPILPNGCSDDENILTWGDWGEDGKGWQLNGDFIAKGDFTFEPSSGYWVKVIDGFTDIKFTCAGEVAMKDIVFNLPEGICVAGNPFPTTIDVISTYPTSVLKGGEMLDGNVSLIPILANGCSDDDNILTWGDWGEDGNGWQLNGDFIAEGDFTLIPGAAYWIKVIDGFTDVKLHFTNPLTDAE